MKKRCTEAGDLPTDIWNKIRSYLHFHELSITRRVANSWVDLSDVETYLPWPIKHRTETFLQQCLTPSPRCFGRIKQFTLLPSVIRPEVWGYISNNGISLTSLFIMELDAFSGENDVLCFNIDFKSFPALEEINHFPGEDSAINWKNLDDARIERLSGRFDHIENILNGCADMLTHLSIELEPGERLPYLPNVECVERISFEEEWPILILTQEDVDHALRQLPKVELLNICFHGDSDWTLDFKNMPSVVDLGICTSLATCTVSLDNVETSIIEYANFEHCPLMEGDIFQAPNIRTVLCWPNAISQSSSLACSLSQRLQLCTVNNFDWGGDLVTEGLLTITPTKFEFRLTIHGYELDIDPEKLRCVLQSLRDIKTDINLPLFIIIRTTVIMTRMSAREKLLNSTRSLFSSLKFHDVCDELFLVVDKPGTRFGRTLNENPVEKPYLIAETGAGDIARDFQCAIM